MRNFIQPGNTLTVIAPTGGVVSGQLFAVGALIGVAAFSAAAGEEVEMTTEGVFDLPKAAPLVIDTGDKLYLGEAGTLSKTDTDTLAAVAVVDAVSAATTVRAYITKGFAAWEPAEEGGGGGGD